MSDVQEHNASGRTGRIDNMGQPTGGSVLAQRQPGDAFIYPTKVECYKILLERMDKYPSSRNETYDKNVNYSGDFNSWFMATGYMFSSLKTSNWAKNGLREAYFECKRTLRWTTREGLIEVNVTGGDQTVKCASNKSCFEAFKSIRALVPRTQMDTIIDTTESNQDEWLGLYENMEWIWYMNKQARKGYHKGYPRVQNETPEKESEQGDVTQESDKQVNTIITRDQKESISVHTKALDEANIISSSEPPHQFPTITKRWMPLDTLKIQTTQAQGALIKTYYLPEDLYSDICSPNLMPFESFIYGRLDIEVRLVVNANKFCCGKLLMSSKYDTYQADLLQSGYQSALARNHVIVDLCTNNEGVLQIPFRYHRPYVRLIKNDTASTGVRPSKYASVYLHMLSALQTGTGGTTEIGARLFFRIKDSTYTGMSYRIPVVKTQGFGLEDIVTPTTGRALREVLIGAEKAFDQLGKSRNQDKPAQIQATTVVPQPRLNFSGGKGVVDVIPLRVNPHTLTNYYKINCPDDEPKSFYDLARIWGVTKSVGWSATDAEGAILLDMIIDPTSRNYTVDIVGEMTPLEYACGNFAFWSGPIELRLDFVSNAFHTGSVQLSAEYGRTSTAESVCQSSATYTKVFHLGDQKSVNFRIPYIYDTVMRRTTSNFVNIYEGVVATELIRKQSITVAPESKTRFKIRVLNALRPVSSAPQKIEILLFMRAGENFHMHGLKGFSYLPDKNTDMMDEFPFDYGEGTSVSRKTREAGKPVALTPAEAAKEVKKDSKLLPKSDRNEWNELKPESLPKYQMDNGEKETQDTTDDFAHGLTAKSILTQDYQLNFKDLLRRPTLILSRKEIPANYTTNSAYFIPLQPPSRQMSVKDQTTYVVNEPWATTIRMSSAMAIMDMFRCWRGSMRYTIVAYGATQPFYVSTVPHSGVRLIGNHQICSDLRLSYPFMGMNFTTAMVIPSVNPTITVEAPYETENTWTLTYEENATLNYSWRDKGDYNAGHLAITTNEKLTIDVWWSAGDDFEIANFYGTPSTKWNGWAYRCNDTHGKPKTQMDNEDFQATESVTTVTGFLKKNIKGSMLARAAIGSIPIVGTPLVIADAVTTATTVMNDTNDRVEKLTNHGIETMEKLNKVADMTQSSISTISGLITQAVDNISTTITGLINGVDILYNLILDILVAWMERSWKVIGVAIVRFFGKFILKGFDVLGNLMEYATQISDYIQNVLLRATPRVQAEPDNTATLIGILAGFVGTVVGVRISPQHWNRSWLYNLGARMTSASGVAYLVHVMNFIKNTFSTLRDMFMKALGYISPEAQALKRLGESSELLEHFVREAQIMTSEANAGMINQPSFRRRYWYVVLQAHQIQRMLCAISTNVVSYQLSKLCNDVIKQGNEKFLDLSASPVRFEPMVICLEGPSGVGKSHVTEELVEHLLKAVNITARTTEKIFYRTSGERFWSGYRDQPVVVYDEWLNTTDPMRCTDQIAELMKLKSTAIFVPEMAHLEEKKIRGNPLIIIICCNNAFPNALSDYATYPQATLRRRDIVMHVDRKTEYAGVNPITCTPEQKEGFKNYEHLQFKAYREVDKKTSLSPMWKDFGAAKNWLVQSWKRYYVHQQEQVTLRMNRLPDYMQNVQGNQVLQDPFTLFYQLNAQIDLDQGVNVNGYTHYEALETALTLTLNAVNNPVPPEEIILEDPIPWDQAQVEVQSDFAAGLGALGGYLGYWGMPKWIAQRTKEQLLLWEKQILPERTITHECLICKEEMACSYVCRDTLESDTPHLICTPCNVSLHQFGNGKCPLCRCDNMVPVINREDINNLSVWMQLVLKGVKGVTWLCDKVVAYYHWRSRSLNYAVLADFFLGRLIALQSEDLGAGFYAGSIIGRYIHLGCIAWDYCFGTTSAAVFQDDEDDWGLWNVPAVQVEPNRQEDVFAVSINMIELENWVLRSKPQALCLHHKLRQHIATAELNGDFWRVMDDETRQVLQVSVFVCEENCRMATEEADVLASYERLLNHWLTLHKRFVRNRYIAYYNEPNEYNMEQVPAVFRPDWIIRPVPLMTQSWWYYLSEKWSQYKTLIIYSGAALSVIAALLGAYGLATKVTAISGALSQNSATAGSPHRAPRNPQRLLTRHGQTHRAYFHSELDTPTVYEVAVGYISRNTFQLKICIGTKRKVMYGTGLFNHCLLIPRHYVREIRMAVEKGCKIVGNPLAQPQLESEIVVTNTVMIESDHTDLAYIMLPPKFPIFKDIRKFLALESDFDTPITSEGVLIANPKSGVEFMREIEVDIMGIEAEQVIIDNNEQTFVVRDVLKYNYSKAGVCGSLLLRENHQRPILSMHFAGIGEGISGYGFGIILTQEALGSLVTNRVAPTQFDDVMYDTVEKAKFVFDDTVHLYYYGSLPAEKVPYIPSKSKLIKSKIFGAPGLETIMEPAILDKKDPRYIHDETPLSAGVRKHGRITTDFTPEQVEKAGEVYWDLWLSKLKPLVADPRELTDEQSVCGLPIDHYTGMDLTTSAGYPYNLDKQRTTKADYIKVIRNEQLQAVGVEFWDTQLTEILQTKRNLRKKGIVPHTLFIDTLKDEKRSHTKAMALGGTRVFCSSPVDYVIECRRYFLHFVAAFMDQRMSMMHAVGINPTSSEWTWLANDLLKKNGKFCTIDYSNFGPGYNSSVAKKAYELMVRWTMQHVKTLSGDTLDELELNCIVYECLQSMHVCNNTVYQQGAGSPSGAFFTTIENTIVNILYLLIAWDALVEVPKLKLKSTAFYENVALFCYGDDGIFSVTPEYLDMYNMQTITAYFSEYGIVATDAAKTGAIKTFEPVSEAQFLKRGFIPHPDRSNMWLSPLVKESIVSCTQWIWKSENIKDATRVNAQAALMEAYTHGPKYFDEFKTTLNKALSKAKIKCLTGTWEEYDDLFFGEGFENTMDKFLLMN